MGEILGMASTHWPLLIQPDAGHLWPFQSTMNRLKDFPEEKKPISAWPEAARVEFGEDEGVSAHAAHRERLLKSFRVMKEEIKAFNPDFILMFGDDQYENFKDDIIPPFCVMAYDEYVSYPFKRPMPAGNVWGEPDDHPIKMQGRPEIAKWLTTRLIEEGVDMAYSYKPLHWEGLGHAFVNIQMFLDYDRTGFDFPMLPISVNCYGSKVIANHGGAPLGNNAPADPSSPTPKRCFEVGQKVAQILKDSPYKVCIYASGGWSHGFLNEKGDYLWPDLEADRLRAQQITEHRETEWKDIPVKEIEDTGQQEFLNWVCLAGAMHELGQKSEVLDFVETMIFNSGKCLAVYRP